MECKIIFITNSRDYALDAFEVDSMQYIVKPVEYTKIKHVLDKCRKLFYNNMRFIEVPSNGLSLKVPLKDIYYIAVYDKVPLRKDKASSIKQIYHDYYFDYMACEQINT